jgi:hypothetical protein
LKSNGRPSTVNLPETIAVVQGRALVENMKSRMKIDIDRGIISLWQMFIKFLFKSVKSESNEILHHQAILVHPESLSDKNLFKKV